MAQPEQTATLSSPQTPAVAKPKAGSGTSPEVKFVFYALAIVAAVVTLGAVVWGPVVLTFAALALVPLVFCFFIAIAWPFPPR